jgi:hypothetical protein
MVPGHNNQQQEKKDNSFDLRICVTKEENKKARQQGIDSICEGRKKEWRVNMGCGPSTQQPTTREER